MKERYKEWMCSWVDVREGERLTVFLMALLFFLMVTSYYVVKPVRNALFLEQLGADNLPYIYIITALSVGVIVTYYSRFTYQKSPSSIIFGTLIFLITNLFVFWWLLHRQTMIVSSLFYVWVKLYPVLVVSQFWLLASNYFTTRQAKRVFGIIGIGGISGGVLGSTLSSQMAGIVGSEDLLFFSAGFLAISFGLLLLIVKTSIPVPVPKGHSAAQEEEEGVGAWWVLKESSHLRTVAVILGLSVIVSTIVDWQFNKAVELFIPGKDEKTAFFGNFFATLNIVSFVVQLLFTSWVLRSFGVGIALLLLPLGLLTASLGILLHPTIWITALAKGTDGTLRYSLDQSTRELLFLPIPSRHRLSAKPFIDMVVSRGGAGIAGVLILVLTAFFSFDLPKMSILTFILTLGWIGSTYVMRREFRGSIKRLLDTRDVELEELVVRNLDAETIGQLRRSLDSADPEEVIYSLTLLEGVGIHVLVDNLKTLLRHPSQEVRAHVLGLLTERGRGDFVSEVRRLTSDPSVEIKAEAIHYVCMYGPGSKEKTIIKYIEAEEPELRAAAVCCIANQGNPDLIEMAGKILEDLMKEGPGKNGSKGRLLVAEVIGNIQVEFSPFYSSFLKELLEDSDPAVRVRAIQSAGKSRQREFVPFLVSRLCCPDSRDAAIKALSYYGDSIHGRLLDYLVDPDLPLEVRKAIPQLLYEIPTQRLVDELVGTLPHVEVPLRKFILKTLNKIRRNYTGFGFHREILERLLLDDVRLGYQALLDKVTLAGKRRSGEEETILEMALQERMNEAIERVSRIMALIYPLQDIQGAYQGLTSHDSMAQSLGYELLENVLSLKHKEIVGPFIDPELKAEERIEKAVVIFPRMDSHVKPVQVLERLMGERDDLWIASLAALEQSGPFHRTLPEFAGPFHDHILPSRGIRFKQILTGDRAIMLKIVERANFLKNVEIFSKLSSEEMAKVAAIMKEKEFRKGEIIFRRSEVGDALYVIVEGRVLLTRDDVTVHEATKGEEVGGLAVFDAEPREFTAMAMERTTTLILGREDFYDLMRTHFEIVKGVLTLLTHVIRRISSQDAGPEKGAVGKRA